MSRHRVLLQDTLPQPWRNGGGSTHELLAWPQPGRWQLRVSVAEITRAGPFSAFPDVDRWFAVLEGAGVGLDLPQGERSLTPADAPLRFDGESAPDCWLIDGPTLDLNLMARRDAGRLQLRRTVANDSLTGATRWRGLFAAEPVLLDCDDITEPVAAGELLWSDDSDGAVWQLRGAGRAWFLELR